MMSWKLIFGHTKHQSSLETAVLLEDIVTDRRDGRNKHERGGNRNKTGGTKHEGGDRTLETLWAETNIRQGSSKR